MPWREKFSNDDIAAALARCGIEAHAADFSGDPTTSWEFDFELTGDITLLTPGAECTLMQLFTISREFQADHVLVEAINTAMPINGATRLRINLIWDKET